jgi:hypothetical protein
MPEANAQNDPTVTTEHTPDNCPIRRPVAAARERLQHAASLHFVIILTDDSLLACHIGE